MSLLFRSFRSFRASPVLLCHSRRKGRLGYKSAREVRRPGPAIMDFSLSFPARSSPPSSRRHGLPRNRPRSFSQALLKARCLHWTDCIVCQQTVACQAFCGPVNLGNDTRASHCFLPFEPGNHTPVQTRDEGLARIEEYRVGRGRKPRSRGAASLFPFAPGLIGFTAFGRRSANSRVRVGDRTPFLYPCEDSRPHCVLRRSKREHPHDAGERSLLLFLFYGHPPL